jgi:type II secretory pathway component PulJ
MKTRNGYTIVELLIALLFLSIVTLGFGAVGWAIYATQDYRQTQARLMKQCMDDGKKEYECRALVR